jgi:hypothetical protein
VGYPESLSGIDSKKTTPASFKFSIFFAANSARVYSSPNKGLGRKVRVPLNSGRYMSIPLS